MTALPTTTIRNVSDLVTKGTTPTSIGRRFTQSGIRFIKVETIGADGQYLPDKVAFIDAGTHSLLRRSQLREGDILFSIAGALGRATVVQASWLPANTNQAFAVIRPSKHSHIDPRYLLWALRSDAIQTHIAEINTRAAQANLSLEQVRDFEIAIPECTNQRNIASVLEDASELITAVQCLIAKKVAIKQGALQELVTGRIRLPGFSRDWTHASWGEVMEQCVSGATPLRSRTDFYGGEIPWVTSTELKYGKITWVPQMITTGGLEAANLTIWPAGTFLMAITGLEAAGTRGSCALLGIPAATNQSCMAIVPNERLRTEFLYYLYLLRGEELAKRYCQGTKQQSYTARVVKSLPIYLPTDVEEQLAIAGRLSDLDAEVDKLRARLLKTRDLRQGMMQELLTGRTRLPVSEAVTA